MGRPYKPHVEVHMRFDADIYRRLKEYVDALNERELKTGKRLTTMTEVVEEATFQYLNGKEFLPGKERKDA